MMVVLQSPSYALGPVTRYNGHVATGDNTQNGLHISFISHHTYEDFQNKIKQF